MTFDEFYRIIHENYIAKQLASQYLEPDKSNRGYICPVCGSGSGPNGTGLTLSDGYFTCWANGDCFGEAKNGGNACFGDIIDVLEAKYKIPQREVIKEISESLNITVKQNEKTFDFDSVIGDKQKQSTHVKKDSGIIKILKDSLKRNRGSYGDLLSNGHKRLGEDKPKEYLNRRGISENNPFYRYMGYYNDLLGLTDAIAIFSSNSSYALREIDGENRSRKPQNENGKHPDIPIGLLDVIREKDKTTEPVFITEGIFDAPSIAETGADAIALLGNSNIDPVIEAFKQFDIKRPLILTLDNDEAGQKAQTKIAERLESAGIDFYDSGIFRGAPYKDPNEFLVGDKDLFIERVEFAKSLPVLEFKESLNISKKERFKHDLLEKSKFPGIKTGFKILDNEKFLDGGLRPGLYVLGAVSSLGKTTLSLQIADQIAAAGEDVIFFSLEMPETEIMTKSISRYTLQNLFEQNELHPGEATDKAKTLYNVYKDYSHDDGTIEKAINDYFSDTGKTMRIITGMGDTSAKKIATEVEKHISVTGKKPVVFIDYLQLLIPPPDKPRNMTDKQIMDANIFRLKQISAAYDIPIFGISSFNRENYTENVSMKSFKESGAIEYSSDVLIGLEPKYMEKSPIAVKGSASERDKAKEIERRQEESDGIRQIRLVILKNRNGKAGGSDYFDFYLKYNCFTEHDENHVISTLD